jgi:hypothetical protein
MNRAKKKKKSSGWLPPQKRSSWQERQARRFAAEQAQARGACDQLRLWCSCPARRCRRVRGCTGDPRRCVQRQSPQIVQQSDARVQASDPAAAAIGATAPHPVLPAAEAAAAIAASIAALPPGADEEFDQIVRDGRIHLVPRRR